MTTHHDAPHEELDGRYWSTTRIGLAIVVLLIVAMWGWIYLFAPRDNPDRLVTRAFATDAEAICVPARAAVDALALESTATTPQERARQVEAGTTLTIDMVAALREASEQLTEADDLQLINAWLDDWDNYIEDREVYIVKLDAAENDTPARDLPFTLRELAAGGVYTQRIDGFATVNDMAACRVPGDV